MINPRQGLQWLRDRKEGEEEADGSRGARADGEEQEEESAADNRMQVDEDASVAAGATDGAASGFSRMFPAARGRPTEGVGDGAAKREPSPDGGFVADKDSLAHVLSSPSHVSVPSPSPAPPPLRSPCTCCPVPCVLLSCCGLVAQHVQRESEQHR